MPAFKRAGTYPAGLSPVSSIPVRNALREPEGHVPSPQCLQSKAAHGLLPSDSCGKTDPQKLHKMPGSFKRAAIWRRAFWKLLLFSERLSVLPSFSLERLF